MELALATPTLLFFQDPADFRGLAAGSAGVHDALMKRLTRSRGVGLAAVEARVDVEGLLRLPPHEREDRGARCAGCKQGCSEPYAEGVPRQALGAGRTDDRWQREHLDEELNDGVQNGSCTGTWSQG